MNSDLYENHIMKTANRTHRMNIKTRESRHEKCKYEREMQLKAEQFETERQNEINIEDNSKNAQNLLKYFYGVNYNLNESNSKPPVKYEHAKAYVNKRSSIIKSNHSTSSIK